MGSLSISAAWDDTKSVLRHDGSLLATVALAFLILPLAVLGVFFPGGLEAAVMAAFESGSVGLTLLALLILILILVGQLAITRLAIGPHLTVGRAISNAARRLPAYVVVGLILGTLLFTLLLIGATIISASAGASMTQEELARSPGLVIVVAVMFIVYLFILARIVSVAAAVAIAEEGGPIRIIRRCWSLTSGHFWRLFTFVLLFLVGSGVAIFAVSSVVGSLLQLSLGKIESMSASALILSLADAAVNGLILLIFAVMLARIYVQLSGADTAAATVPRSGT